MIQRFRIIFTEYIQFVIMKCIEYIYIYIYIYVILRYIYIHPYVHIPIILKYIYIYIYIYMLKFYQRYVLRLRCLAMVSLQMVHSTGSSSLLAVTLIF